jgi:hypothetical protein
MRPQALGLCLISALSMTTLTLTACSRAQSVAHASEALTGGTGSAAPVRPGAPAGPPDRPLDAAQGAFPMTVAYVVEHRSALDRSWVKVKGVVVWTLLGDAACASGPGMCAQPRIKIADSPAATRNPAYDLTVVLPTGGDAAYAVGQWVELSGQVAGGPSGVVIRSN